MTQIVIAIKKGNILTYLTFGGGTLHLQSQIKCQLRLNRARINAPNDSGGSGERLGGEGKL